jgi:hypothetical protein
MGAGYAARHLVAPLALMLLAKPESVYTKPSPLRRRSVERDSLSAPTGGSATRYRRFASNILRFGSCLGSMREVWRIFVAFERHFSAISTYLLHGSDLGK